MAFSEQRIKRLNLFLGSILGLYLVYALYFFSVQRSMVYSGAGKTPPDSMAILGDDVARFAIPIEGGIVHAVYLLPQDSDGVNPPYPTVLFAHGNASVIEQWPKHLAALREMGFGVLLPEYPGYGNSDGKPSQRLITDVVVAAYDSAFSRGLLDTSNVLLIGHSLGTGIVNAVAGERPSKAMILVAGFTTLRVFTAKYLLPGFLMTDPWDNLKALRDYENPVMVIHGQNDEVVPYGHGVTLYENCARGALMTTEGTHNHPLPTWNEIWRSVEPFLFAAGLLDTLTSGIPILDLNP